MSTAAVEDKKPIGKAGLLEVSTTNELKELGWRVDKLDSGWHASEINGDRRIGPAASIAALATQVKLASGPVVAKGNGKGNGKADPLPEDRPAPDAGEQRLPTMEEPEIDELNRQADDCIFAKEKRDKAKTEFDDHCDIMREKMREFGRKRYNRRGFSIVLEETEKIVIKKAEQAPPKNPSTKANRGVTVVKG